MSEKDNGGPAFARPGHEGETTITKGSPGMTLRDWFAGQVASGLCANSGGPYQANGLVGWGLVNCTVQTVAKEAYSIADAMIEERSK